MDTYTSVPLYYKHRIPFLTEIESTQLNQFSKHKTKDFYVPGARKYAGIQKNITMAKFLSPDIQ